MAITHDTSFVDSLSANVAVQFWERVESSPPTARRSATRSVRPGSR